MSNCMRKRLARNKKLVIGLTGSFGSGKSTAARFFKARGAEIIDADKIAHTLLDKPSNVSLKVLSCFGTGYLGRGKRIDRNKLATLVFNNKAKLLRLNAIVHPEVRRRIKNAIASSRRKIVVVDAPLLIEAGLAALVDVFIVVTIDRKLQLKRLLIRSGLKKEDIEKRIKAQMRQKAKVRWADFIIDNSGTIARTKRQVKSIWEKVINTPR
jgi:dephospho-CoA kinase